MVTKCMTEYRTKLHPDEQEQLRTADEAGIPNVNQVSVAGARELLDSLIDKINTSSEERVADIREYTIPGSQDGIRTRIYTPRRDKPLPVLIWYHSGGWVRGDLDTADYLCRLLTNRIGCSIVSVDYRLAPEYPFPAALKDCYTATAWVADNPEVVHGNPDKIAVGGLSAGGNLAASVSLMSRDRHSPSIQYQLLANPITNYSFETQSYEENDEGYGLSQADMRWYWNHYLADELHGQNPYASPLQARQLNDLPPAIVLTSGFDPVRDDGIEYVQRLEESDVQVKHINYQNATHAVLGSVALEKELQPAKEALEDTVNQARTMFDH